MTGKTRVWGNYRSNTGEKWEITRATSFLLKKHSKKIHRSYILQDFDGKLRWTGPVLR